jgi:hypothetical protein
MKRLLLLAAFLLGPVAGAAAQTSGVSAFATRPDDPRAIQLTGAAGDGKADDSAAIQAAILFGGTDGQTLFILTHHALYAVKT